MDIALIITLVASGLLSLLLIVIVEGMFKREAPFGEVADYVIAVIAGVGVAALDYFVIIPIFFKAKWIIMASSVAEGVFCAWLVPWLIRQLARAPIKTEDDEYE